MELLYAVRRFGPMNVILVRKEEIYTGMVTLTDERARHVVKVLRSEVGEVVRLGIIDGKLGEGEIIELQRKFPFKVVLRVNFQHEPEPKSPIDLLLALPRPIMLRRIMGQATSLGVEKLFIINGARVEKSFWGASIVEKDTYMPYLIGGLEQAIDTVVPEVTFHRRFQLFFDENMETIQRYYDHLLLAHPQGTSRLDQVMKKRAGRVLVAIGPEGGWVDHELEWFLKYGFSSFTLGPRILRVDSAVVNIHGRIMAHLESLSDA